MPNKKMSTRFEDKKWVQKIKIENEYNINTNQIGPKFLRWKHQDVLIKLQGFWWDK